MLDRRVLVLNASYEVLNLTNLKRALKLLLTGKAETVRNNGLTIHAGSLVLPAPSVVKLRYFVPPTYHVLPLNRKNVLFRDNFTCQYCGSRSLLGMTIDHIVPRSQGGKTVWDNVVCACKKCNAQKGDRCPQEARMKLCKKPVQPVYTPLFRAAAEHFPPEWAAFLPPQKD